MLPLVFILVVTAIKDGVEDYRRATLDEEVNNSAATKLAQWRNVNQPSDPREWFEKLLGLNPPGKVTKGVRKLREKEASEGAQQIVLAKQGDDRTSMASSVRSRPEDSTVSLGQYATGRRLEDIQSVDSHSYPPGASMSLASSHTHTMSDPDLTKENSTAHLVSSPEQTWSTPTLHGTPAASRTGVVDLSKRPAGVARWERTLWKKLEVGDIVLLRDNEQIPADIAVLSTSDADGMCYIETKNLDGETNLKPRKSIRGTSYITSEADVERSSFFLDSEPAHANLYLYNGVLRYRDSVSGEMKQESVTINELLLRGCTVRNTDWIIGLVVFTGADTKIMLNGGETPSKRSKIEKETNFNVVMNFIVLILMCTVTAIASGMDDAKSDTSRRVYEVDSEASDSHVVNAIVTFV
jgi:phospholipid-translocating ATPase